MTKAISTFHSTIWNVLVPLGLALLVWHNHGLIEQSFRDVLSLTSRIQSVKASWIELALKERDNITVSLARANVTYDDPTEQDRVAEAVARLSGLQLERLFTIDASQLHCEFTRPNLQMLAYAALDYELGSMGLISSQYDADGSATEALELFDALLDAGASAVERFRKESGSVLGIRLGGNDGADAAGSGGLAVGLAVVALVADNGARRDVRPEVEQDREVPAVARLPGGQVEGDRQAAEVGLEVDLGREAAARAAKSLAVLPPFEPAADTCARAVVESSICTRWAVVLVAASASNMASNTPDRLSRQKRFQTAFQSPNSAGSARHVML